MEKIKDFFYDKNDLVVALIIIAVAGLLIAWRVDIIMEYPQVMAAEIERQQQEQTQKELDAMDTAGDGETADSNDQEGGDQTPATTPSGVAQNGNGDSQSGSETGDNDSQSPATSSGNNSGSGTSANSNSGSGSNSGPVTITIPAGSSGGKIAEILVNAGVVNSKDEFNSAVAAAGAETRLQAGTFQIPANATPAEVVAIITK